MSYAGIPDLITFGLPATAFGNTTTLQQQGALDAASAEMDSYFRARYDGDPVTGKLPFASWGTDVTEKCVAIAQWKLLLVRGFNPGAGADKNIRERYLDAINWLVQVKENKLHPFVVAPTTKQYDQPVCVSNKPRGF
jgi:phage gp36-like protein